MRKLKKWLIGLLCLVCTGSMAAFIACNDTGSDSSSSSNSSSVSSSDTTDTGTTDTDSTSTGDTTDKGDDKSEDGSGAVATVTSVTISGDTEVTAGASITLTATVVMSDGSKYDGSIEWSSDKEAVATVSDGVVEGVAAGTATITAKAGDVSDTYDITVKAAEKQYETVKSEMDYEAAIKAAGGSGSNYKTTSEYTYAQFTYASGVYFENTNTSYFDNGNVNTQQKDITVKVTSSVNTLYFKARGASTSTLTIVNSKGENISFEADGTSTTSVSLASSVVVITATLDAGEYTIKTVSSARLGDMYVTQYLEVSAASGITATAGTTDFLIGRDFSYTDLSVITNYENGSTRVNSDYTVAVYSDAEYTKTVEATSMAVGTYYVKVTSTVEETEYFDGYTITVHDIKDITLYTYTYSSSGTVTNHLQTIYIKDSNNVIDYNYLTVVASTDNDDVTFILDADSEYSVESSIDLTTAGTYNVTVKNTVGDTKVTKTYPVYVVDKISASGTSYTVNVDAGAAVSVDTSANTATFTTVTQALQYLSLIGADNTYTKVVEIAAGTYYEKIYVDMPNVQFIGKGSTYDDVVLYFDRIAGMTTPTGTGTYSTDGSASVTLSKNATGFYAENLTFKNYYNTHALYQESLTISSSSMAVALLNQADQTYIYNCKITSYHDTLYAQIGRQVYTDCYIEGRTDYIFGYNATAYFYNCTLNTIGAGESKNGGYVVATKGYDNDNTKANSIVYGYIFNDCDFIADSNAVDGTVSIARGWGTNMRIMVMNSTISGAYSTEYYGNSSSEKNDRYTAMNASPVAEYLLEYNNTGAGAVYASKEAAATQQNTDEGVTTYTAETTTYTVYNSETYTDTFTLVTDSAVADVYSTLTTIFGATNGSKTYSEDWDGTHSSSSYAVKVYTVDNIEVGQLAVKAGDTVSEAQLESLIASNIGNCYTLVAAYSSYTSGTEYTAYDYSAVTADSTIYVSITLAAVAESFSYNLYNAIEGLSVSSGDSLGYGYLLIEGGNSGSFTNNGSGWYMLTNDATISLKLAAGSTLELTLYSSDALAISSNGSALTVSDYVTSENSIYTFSYTASAEETIVISMASGSSNPVYIRSIAVDVPVVYQINSKIDFSSTTSDDVNIQSGTGTYLGLEIDASNSQFKGNGNSVKVTTGTVIKINSVAGATAQITWYPDYGGTVEISTSADGVITITLTAMDKDGGAYITAIDIIAKSE